MDFIELLYCNDEFSFKYNDIKYAIVSENGNRSIYDEKTNKIIGRYLSNDNLLNNAVIDGKKIAEILNEIEIM